MKHSLFLALSVVLVLLAGCTTTSFAGLAKASHVDALPRESLRLLVESIQAYLDE